MERIYQRTLFRLMTKIQIWIFCFYIPLRIKNVCNSAICSKQIILRRFSKCRTKPLIKVKD